MARINNTSKVFNFRVEINGIDTFEFQKFKLPDVEIESVEHGDGNRRIKTAGQVKIGEMVAEKLRPIQGANKREAMLWLNSAQNHLTGAGGLATDYKRTVVVRELHPNNRTTLTRWLCDGVWCSKIARKDFDALSSDNMIETLTLQLDGIDEI